ncbi:Endo-1,4-beta-xylanase/feruloyl esterase precursor [Phycisphaerae bacterium RAS1]|nr:Endo-1,4-beta-xylanase/feruloyl esterase precursor [Phycisphaerae bacterium RAS1]
MLSRTSPRRPMSRPHSSLSGGWSVAAIIASALAAPALAPVGTAGDVSSARVRFVVVTPDAEPFQDRIFCAMSVDGWPADGRPLARVSAGLYEATWSLPAGAAVEYKFTRTGTWQTVEKSAAGGELANRSMTPNGEDELVIVHAIARWADQAPLRRVLLSDRSTGGDSTAPRAKRSSTRTGDIRVHDAVESPQLGNTRTVLVYLPPGYEKDAERRYPVLYMHDGNNVFDEATSFGGVEWSADETAQRLIAAGKIRPLIIVAIYNNADRRDEYTHARDDRFGGGGRGDLYVAFIAETLKPLIDRTYRTRPDAGHTAIAGSSLGGLISLYAAYKRPDVFGTAGVVSPALAWNERSILEVVRGAPPETKPRVWLDMGTEEGSREGPMALFTKAVSDCRALVEILKARGCREGADFRYEEIEGGRHHERDWAKRFDRLLEFIDAGWRER